MTRIRESFSIGRCKVSKNNNEWKMILLMITISIKLRLNLILQKHNMEIK